MSRTPQHPLNAGSRGRLLSVERIVDQAMWLASMQGLAGLSMRRLADSLDVQAMTLYHYVANRAALLGLMADYSATAILVEDDDAVGCRWDDRLLDLSMNIYRAGVDNPALIEAIIIAPLPTPTLTAAAWQAAPHDAGDPLTGLLQRVSNLLDQAPLPGTESTTTLHALISLLIGLAARAASTRPALVGHAEHARHALTTFLRPLSDSGSSTAQQAQSAVG